MHYSQFHGKTMAQIRNRLIKQGMKAPERQALLDEIQAYRSKLRSEVAQATYYRNVWHKFSMPLLDEIQRVRVAMHYRANVRRNIVLMGYRELLDELHELFKGLSHGKRTPLEIARHNNLPNDGTHWTDWIPQNDKERILEDFALVREHGRKMYRPFERRESGKAEEGE